MANFTRQDNPNRTRYIITIGATASDFDVDVTLTMSDGYDKIVGDITRAEIIAATTGPQRTNTLALLAAIRALAVTRAGGT
jgi:hypothetical protein